MALSFLRDRDENEVLGNLGAFAQAGGTGNSVQAALEIYRRDQQTHHEQSIASDLTRGLLRKVFRETVLESSKQVKRKYSYSAVGSTVAEEMEDQNLGITSKLKKLQKERLIVARLGFPDKAMEIDGHIEKIRADLREEREKEDLRILKEDLDALALEHSRKLSELESELKVDEERKTDTFNKERTILTRKQEKQFAQLVDNAIKRAIGKSKSCSCVKKYLCHHNKTASFNTRRPKKEVIHFRKNAKRLRHGGRLDESAAWEEKAAELDAEHLDNWREEVAASLTASAWGGSSSPLDQLAAQHQREIKRMETAQANEWTLMMMRHHTLRRNYHNVIMVEQKKLRTSCKKEADERHRRGMLKAQASLEAGASPSPERKRPSSGGALGDSGGGAEDVKGMLRDALSEGVTGEEGSQGHAGARPVRPSSAPPARGRRPQPNQQAPEEAAAVEAAAGNGDGNSSAGGSRDLEGFRELEEEDFNYDEYPAAGSPEEPEWVHAPWCGTNSGDIPALDMVVTAVQSSSSPSPATDDPRMPEASVCDPVVDGQEVRRRVGNTSTTATVPPSPNGDVGVSAAGARSDDDDDPDNNTAGGLGGSTSEGAGGDAFAGDADDGERDDRVASTPSDSSSTRLAAAAAVEKLCRSPVGGVTHNALQPSSSLAADLHGDPNQAEGDKRGASRKIAVGSGNIQHFDWNRTLLPTRPTLSAISHVSSGSRADKIKARNAKRKNPNKKAVSWGENLEVPPEPEGDGSDGTASAAAGEDETLVESETGDERVDEEIIEYGIQDTEGGDGHIHDGESSLASKPATPTAIKKSAAVTGSHEGGRIIDMPSGSNFGGVAADAESLPLSAERGANEGAAVCMADAAATAAIAAIAAAEEADLQTLNDERGNKGFSQVDETNALDPDVIGHTDFKHESSPGTVPVEGEVEDSRGSRSECSPHAHPLQHALDVFLRVRALHGDWLKLLGQMVAQVACRTSLREWSRKRPWEAAMNACLGADTPTGADGSVSWGAARAEGIAVACPSVLASFLVSPFARRMVGSKAGRKAMGGSTIEEESALARSRRPWRTLFERTLGSLPHGAVLSLAGKTDSRNTPGIDREMFSNYAAVGNFSNGDDSSRAAEGRGEARKDDQTRSPMTKGAAVPAGKVVWANEGFERLACVDAIDVVGEQLGSLFEVGAEEGEKLVRSLEVGTRCTMWMTMAGQGSEPTDVLCLHQPITVPPELSDEGHYSALLFFDTASVVLEGIEVVDGCSGRGEDGIDGGEKGWAASTLNREAETGEDRQRKQQYCNELSKAMMVLLSGVDDSGDAGDGNDGINNARGRDGRDCADYTRSEGNGNDKGIGCLRHEPFRDSPFAANAARRTAPVADKGTGDNESHRVLLRGKRDGSQTESFSSQSQPMSPSLMSKERPERRVISPDDASPVVRQDYAGQCEHESHIERQDALATSLQGPVNFGGYSEMRNTSALPDVLDDRRDKAAAIEYSSGDDSSAEPRDDLLLSPEGSAVENELAVRTGGKSKNKSGTQDEYQSDKAPTSLSSDRAPLKPRPSADLKPEDVDGVHDAGRSCAQLAKENWSTLKVEGEGGDDIDDQYEDDFFSDEEGSLVSPEDNRASKNVIVAPGSSSGRRKRASSASSGTIPPDEIRVEVESGEYREDMGTLQGLAKPTGTQNTRRRSREDGEMSESSLSSPRQGTKGTTSGSRDVTDGLKSVGHVHRNVYGVGNDDGDFGHEGAGYASSDGVCSSTTGGVGTGVFDDLEEDQDWSFSNEART